MIEFEISESENERLAELYDFDILDTETERDFDEIVQLAATICESPVSLISLIDRDRVWFKSRLGVSDRETARNFAFCSYAIEEDTLMQVDDASLDARFCDNPLVTDQPNIRFYAGMPLVTSKGNKMGTLCVMDSTPKVLSENQRLALEILAKQVMRQMEFRRLSTKLRASIERNSIFVQQAPNALAMFDRNMCYIAASQKWLEDYNLKDRQVIGKSHYEIFPEISDDWKQIHQDCLNGAINQRDEARFVRADGSEQWITWDVRPWYISDGNIGGLLMYTADLTAIKEKDEENRRIREILEKTNQVARIGAWEINCITGELTWSAIMREIHEVDPDVTPHLDAAMLFFVEGSSRDSFMHHYQQALFFGDAFDLELELVTAKGNRVWVHIIAQSDFANGRSKRVYGVYHDITERKKAELAMIEARNLAEQSATLKETFLANMSHEIRTPMNAIIGFTDLLLKRNLGNEEREYVRIVKNSGENLLRIINDILDISKINSGMMTFEAHPVNIKELFYSLRAMLARSAEEKGLGLAFETAQGIPAALLGDPTRLSQIILNLAGNAIKFTKNGFVNVYARLLDEKDDRCTLEFSVRDTGIGIAKDKLLNIFERFSQAEAHTTRRYGGTGLGLSIARQLVELQGGTISINSNPGMGTAVIFTLPFLKVKSPAPTQLPKATIDIAGLNTMRLLLVDDNPINIKLLLGLLSDYTVKVITADNGRKALDILKTETVDLVLLDIEMPEMNGYETIEHIRTVMGSKIPVIAMTANAMSGERERCLRMGMNDYISKPIKTEELFQKIAEVAESSGAAKLPIDLSFLRESMGGREDLVIEVLNLFLETVPDDMRVIGEAAASGDVLLVKRRAHKLLSSVLALGASDMEALLKDMEAAAGEKNTTAIAALYKSLEPAYQYTIRHVLAEKNRLSRNYA